MAESTEVCSDRNYFNMKFEVKVVKVKVGAMINIDKQLENRIADEQLNI